MPRLARRLFQHLQDLRLDRDVQRGGRLVGDQQLRLVGHRHGDHHPLPHAARELVRVLLHALARLRDRDQVEQIDRARHRGLAREVAVDADRLDDLLADPQHGIERGQRVLEDHADACAADRLQRLRRHAQELLAAEARRAGDRGRPRQQAQDAEHADALAGAGFADHAEHRGPPPGRGRCRATASSRTRPGREADAAGPGPRAAVRLPSLRAHAVRGSRIVAQAVAEEVEAEHDGQDRQARPEGDPPVIEVDRAIRDHRAPFRASAAPRRGR